MPVESMKVTGDRSDLDRLRVGAEGLFECRLEIGNGRDVEFA
jgi:hypothetical protein